jgi:hypothetical protein
VGHGDCENPTPQCAGNVCVKCTADAACAGRTDATVCDTTTDANYGGTCVECTVNDETACDPKACNPDTRDCTGTTDRHTLIACKPCVADSECVCLSADCDAYRCVPMKFNAVAHGGYCLQSATTVCPRPFTVGVTAASRSGAASATYCGVDQDTTTCEAVLDLVDATVGGALGTCSMDSDCGAAGLADGLCKTLLPGPRCTYGCGALEQCPSGFSCTSNYCQ